MLFRTLSAIRATVGLIWHDRRGVAAVFLAVSLVPVIGGVGLAIDSALGYLVKTRMGKSLDAAGLAAGRVALDDNAEEIALSYFEANFGPGGRDVTLTDFNFSLDETQHFVTLSAVATTPTFFMRIFGRDEMTVSARTVIERQTTGMELALVIDNTGSMFGANFNAMQAATYELVDIIYGEDTEIDNVWVSLVPYVSTVNIGNTRTSWLEPADPYFITPKSSNPFRPDLTDGGWKGCVMAQAYPYDTNDTPISTKQLKSFAYAPTASTKDNNWPTIKPKQVYNNGVNDSRGPNLGCGPTITPLTASRSTVDAAIGNMAAWGRGGTTSNLGLSWGWRTISPRWRGAWGGETPSALPLNYKTDNMEKVVVLLTDGDNQFHDNDDPSGKDDNEIPASDYTGYGRIEALIGSSAGKESARRTKGKEILNARMLETCTAMKAEGVKIYTIIFSDKPSAETKTLFETCATTPAMYYYAPKAQDIAKVFRAIGGQLANLLIVE